MANVVRAEAEVEEVLGEEAEVKAGTAEAGVARTDIAGRDRERLDCETHTIEGLSDDASVAARNFYRDVE